MTSTRHLPWEIFKQNYIDPNVPARYPLHGSPDAHIVFQPTSRHLELIIDTPPLLEVETKRQYIFSDVFEDEAKEKLRLFVNQEAVYREFYAICTEVADKIQLLSEPSHDAIRETLASFDLLLKKVVALANTTEIGLIGELLVLRNLIDIKGAEAAEAWRGPDRDRHDFRIDTVEMEVKTTTTGAKAHWIHGLNQLEASEGCGLAVITVELARTTGKSALSLGSLTASISSRLSSKPMLKSAFLDSLKKIIQPTEPEQASGRFVLKSPIKAFAVNDSFPRLRQSHIQLALKQQAAAILKVDYHLDFAQIQEGNLPKLVEKIVAINQENLS